MDIFAWIVIGAIAGWLANVIAKGSGRGLLSNIITGIAGSFVGGIVMNLAGGAGITGFNPYSLLVATGGAVLLIIILRAVSK